MIEKLFVKNLKEKDQFVTVFMVTELKAGKDRNGKDYMSMNLKDSSGSINARVFDNVPQFVGTFEAGDFVTVKAHVQLYQGRPQLLVHHIKKSESEEYDIKDFVSNSKVDPNQMLKELLSLVEGFDNHHIQQLTLNCLQDAEVKEKILKAPAAKSIHHAYMGGLLEHVLSICGVMKGISENYPYLNSDLLYFGAIFHDLGKVWELDFSNGIQYTDEGRLIGHMVLACDLVEKQSQKILGFPVELKMVLKHIILSHHGRLEYGSPKRPKFPEAYVVAMIDELDSKLFTMSEFMKSEKVDGQSWTRFHSGFERYFYLDILKDKEE